MTTTPTIRSASRLTGVANVAGAALLWGTVGVLVRGINAVAPDANALVTGFLRLAIAGPVLLLAHLITARTHPLRFARRDWPAALLLGGALAVYQVAEFAAIPRLGVTRTILLVICTAPGFIALFAAVALRERIPARAAPPVLLALAGTALLIGTGEGGAPLSVSGMALALSAAAAYALVVTASRALAPRYPATQTVTVAVILGAAVLAPFALAPLVLRANAGAFALGGWGWLLAVTLGLVPTAGAYLLFLRGVRVVPAMTAGILSLLEPLAAALLAAALFSERLTPRALLGAGVLLVSLLAFVVVTAGSSET